MVRSRQQAPYKRTLPVNGLAPGPHQIYARVYYTTARGSTKLRKGTVKRHFTRLVAFPE